MPFDIDEFLDGCKRLTQIPELVKDSAHRNLARHAFDSYVKFVQGRETVEECLGAIIKVITCPDSHVACSGVPLLNILATRSEIGQKSILDLVATGNSDTRSFAIDAVVEPYRLPISFVAEVLRKALSDPDRAIRISAAQHVWELDVKSMLPDMLRMRENLFDDDEKIAIDLSIELTRDGYSIERCSELELAEMRNSDGSASHDLCRMKVRCPYGDTATLIGGYVSQSQIDAKGAAEIARAMCERHLAPRSK